MTYLGDSIEDVVETFKIYLEVKYPQHLTALLQRERRDPQSVMLEAAMFSVVRFYGYKPVIGEVIGEGGVDFICRNENKEFLLEVTHLEKEAVERQSGMKDAVEDGQGGSFSMITHVLRTKASEKAAQVSDYNMPRMLCIGTVHSGAQALLGKVAAKWLLTSETKIAVPIGEAKDKIHEETSLEHSVFFRFDENGSVEPCRQSISAILLVGLFHDSCSVVGLLHPEPAYCFPISLLPDIPFLRIANWPMTEGMIETEWIISDPGEKSIPLRKIEIFDEELRTI